MCAVDGRQSGNPRRQLLLPFGNGVVFMDSL
jgi:hypothetical protein